MQLSEEPRISYGTHITPGGFAMIDLSDVRTEETIPMEPIVAQFDRNGIGDTLTCNASFIEYSRDDGRIVIQFCDVMAYDNGDGDPITGVSISLAPEQRAEWAKAFLSPGTLSVPEQEIAALKAEMEAALGNPYHIDAETLLYLSGRQLQRWIAQLAAVLPEAAS